MEQNSPAIFKSLDISYIQPVLENIYSKDILEIKIDQNSPTWATSTCLVKYSITFSDNFHSYVRGSASLESKNSSWETLSALYSKGFSSGNYQVPKPLSYLEEINLLLYEEAPGHRLLELLEDPNSYDYMVGIAEWLSKMHSLDARSYSQKPALFYGEKGYTDALNWLDKEIPELGTLGFSKSLLTKIDSL